MRIEVYLSAEERAIRVAKLPQLKQSAANGDVKAQVELAWELAQGRVVEANFAEATRLFESAAASGDDEAILSQARFLQLRHVPAGTRTIRRFAAMGNGKAQFWMGRYLQNFSGRQSQLRSAVWYKRAYRSGVIGGQFALQGQLFRLAPFYRKPDLLIRVLFDFLIFLLSGKATQSDFESQMEPLMFQLKRR